MSYPFGTHWTLITSSVPVADEVLLGCAGMYAIPEVGMSRRNRRRAKNDLMALTMAKRSLNRGQKVVFKWMGVVVSACHLS